MKLTTWTKGDPVTLMEILDAREVRAALQRKMLQTAPASLISFTLNIPGPVKTFPFTAWLYEVGKQLISDCLQVQHTPVLDFGERKEKTGYEAFYALSLSPLTIKKQLTELELSHPLGRFFDFDVLAPDGSKISRQDAGFPPRTCLLCNRSAFLCGRARTHSAEELLAYEIQKMEAFYQSRMSVHLGLMMQKALFYEVNTSLKPGLVDRLHNGSHTDMCRETFIKSAYALTPYFCQCAKEGLAFSESREHLPDLFLLLRDLGKQAEQLMLRTCHGVNTHKGVIFSGGLLCALAGYAASQYLADFTADMFPHMLSALCRDMLPHLLQDYQNLEQKQTFTHGELLYKNHQITGIRGEAQKGFPLLTQHGLPRFLHALHQGFSCNDAGLLALLYYIAHTEDTNLITRADYETAKRIQASLAAFLKTASYPEQLAILPQLDAYFVSKQISPGGSADLLALTYFFYFLKEKPCCFT